MVTFSMIAVAFSTMVAFSTFAMIAVVFKSWTGMPAAMARVHINRKDGPSFMFGGYALV
jgi:hypothetical protein